MSFLALCECDGTDEIFVLSGLIWNIDQIFSEKEWEKFSIAFAFNFLNFYGMLKLLLVIEKKILFFERGRKFSELPRSSDNKVALLSSSQVAASNFSHNSWVVKYFAQVKQ